MLMSYWKCPVISRHKTHLVVKTESVNIELVDYFMDEHYKELTELNQWQFHSHKTSTPLLSSLAGAVNKHYDVLVPLTLYRGFDNAQAVGTLGRHIKGHVFKKLDMKIGEKVETLIKHPISYTADYNISKSYGRYVVKVLDNAKAMHLALTDEINYALAKYFRGYDVSTSMMIQKECLLLPTNKSVPLQLIIKGRHIVNDDNVTLPPPIVHL